MKIHSIFLILLVSVTITVVYGQNNESLTIKGENKIQTNTLQNSDKNSKLADPTLMFTISQVSAVFVAITTGLYTTKLISISTEKLRLKSKLAEIKTELIERKSLVTRYGGIIDRIESSRALKRIEHVIDMTYDEPSQTFLH